MKVQRAIEYAREAHAGQFRRTGEPYITHCIHTAKILAALIPPQEGKRVRPSTLFLKLTGFIEALFSNIVLRTNCCCCTSSQMLQAVEISALMRVSVFLHRL